MVLAGANLCRTAVAVDAKGLPAMIKRAAEHDGTALIEVPKIVKTPTMGFCPREDRKEMNNELKLEHGKPLIFGADGSKGIVLFTGDETTVVDVAEHGVENLLVHDETNHDVISAQHQTS